MKKIKVYIVLFVVFLESFVVADWGVLTDLFPDVCPVSNSWVTCDHLSEKSQISTELVSECLKCSREMCAASSKRGNQLTKSGLTVDAYPTSMHHFFSGSLPSEAGKVSKISQELITATKLMQLKFCNSCNEVTPNTFMSFLEHQVIKIKDYTFCQPIKLTCDPRSKYRTIDGSCNNLDNPGWGRKNAPFTRIAKPRYADGIYSMPVAVSGEPLPNPRVLSSRLFSDQPIVSKVLNYLNLQWGQFVAHDMSLQVMESTDEGGIQCCVGNGQGILPPEWLNDKCIPITVPDTDPFYSQYNVKCLNFVRSVTTLRDDCSLGHAEQMNSVTSFLDGSVIYGSDEATANKLRSKVGGKLRVVNKFNCKRGYLPEVDDKMAVCDLTNSSEPCYLGGDIRINQTPALALVQTLWVREHNRVAEILGKLNPLWTDEKLFQETRRIVIAELQHITYQEWLPLNLGEKYVKYYRISPTTLYSREYNDEVNPGIINGFAAAAYRYLHTLIPYAIMSCPAQYTNMFGHRLSDNYFNPRLLEESTNSFDDVIRGMVRQSSAEADPFFTGEISNMLFKSTNKWGLDLIAMDIQRGRDHGLASYNDYREVCGLKRANTFQDLCGEISQDRINALGYYYESVDDIDLFIGGVLETDLEGSILGPTFQCIVAEQFYRTRVGDRFFYDNAEMPHSFSPEQLKEIKKASMARLICDNTDGVYYMQKRAFEIESPYNPRFSCDDYEAIPFVDLMPWKKPLFDLGD